MWTQISLILRCIDQIRGPASRPGLLLSLPSPPQGHRQTWGPASRPGLPLSTPCPPLALRTQADHRPDELGAGVMVFVDSPCEPAVLQGQLLQQLEVHVGPDAHGEDADPAPGGLPGVVEDLEGVGLPDGGLPVRQEDHEGHAAVLDVVVGHVVVEQLDAPQQGPVDVRACGTQNTMLEARCLPHLDSSSHPSHAPAGVTGGESSPCTHSRPHRQPRNSADAQERCRVI